MQVSTGGGGVQRRPPLAVLGVHVCAMVQQHGHHRLRVVDAALRQNGRRSDGERIRREKGKRERGEREREREREKERDREERFNHGSDQTLRAARARTPPPFPLRGAG